MGAGQQHHSPTGDMGMKKNVSGQKIGAQMVSATDGSAFTGSVTVSVTVDAGTQATGSVGSGACTHEGNGYHTYAPAQGETNGDQVAFTFTGTGAIPATVQVFPSFPQTGDNFALIGSAGAGLTALASAANLATVAGYLDTEIAAILAAVDTEVAAIKAVTDLLNAAQSEPTGVPAANATPLTKLGILYMMARNRIDVTAAKKIYYDDGGAAEFEKDLSDDGTTYSESEVNAP